MIPLPLLGQVPPVGLAAPQLVGMVLLDLVIILVAARLVGGAFVRIGQPRVVGEIVSGILLGPTLLGATVLVWDAPFAFLDCGVSMSAPGSPAEQSITACFFPAQSRSILAAFGQLALIFFMFLVGTEVDLDRLKGKAAPISVVAVGVVAIPVAVAFLISPFFFDAMWVAGFGTAEQPGRPAFTFMVAAMIAVTAFPVMARILQEKGKVDSPSGVVGVAAAAIVTILMFLLVALASGLASGASAGSHVLRLVGTVAFLGGAALARPLLARTVGTRIERAGTVDTPTFAWLVILALSGAYLADRIGINVITGAFVAGVILPARAIVRAALNARLFELTTAILLPVFLAVSGLVTDFTKLGLSSIVGVVVFIAVSIAAKWGGGAVSARVAGFSWAEGNLLGILMNCRGLLVLVVALIGLTEGVISPQLQAAGVMMALVTTAMTGPLFDRFEKATADVNPPRVSG